MPGKSHRKKVPEGVKKALNNELREPQLAELASWWFQIAGGPRQVAKILYEEFQSAKAGSIIRQRILEMILRTVKYANDKSSGTTDLGLLSQDDLEREMSHLLKEMGDAERTSDTELPGAGTPSVPDGE